MTNLLSLNHFGVAIDGAPLFQPINLSFGSGIHSICGASGMGKSSLLLGIVDLLGDKARFSAMGNIELNGVCRSKFTPLAFRRRVCLLPQHPVMFVGSILDNLFIGALSHKLIAKKQRAEHAQMWLSRVGLWNELQHRLHTPAFKLSLGQQQRLALARTLAIQPDFILLDEPTASLDKGNTSAIEEHLLDLSAQSGFLLVSHNTAQVTRLSQSCTELVPCQSSKTVNEFNKVLRFSI